MEVKINCTKLRSQDSSLDCNLLRNIFVGAGANVFGSHDEVEGGLAVIMHVSGIDTDQVFSILSDFIKDSGSSTNWEECIISGKRNAAKSSANELQNEMAIRDQLKQLLTDFLTQSGAIDKEHAYCFNEDDYPRFAVDLRHGVQYVYITKIWKEENDLVADFHTTGWGESEWDQEFVHFHYMLPYDIIFDCMYGENTDAVKEQVKGLLQQRDALYSRFKEKIISALNECGANNQEHAFEYDEDYRPWFIIERKGNLYEVYITAIWYDTKKQSLVATFCPLDSFDDEWNQVLNKLTGWIPYQGIYDNYLELKNQEPEEDE